jgi:hypothetical protein
MYAVLRELQRLLAVITGACHICGQKQNYANQYQPNKVLLGRP